MKLTVNAQLAVPATKAWDYYTQPGHITQWNFASPDWHCPHAETELCVGGRYLAHMAAKDGSSSFDFEATFTEVNPPHGLALRMVNGRVVVVEFLAQGPATQVSVTFDAETENPVEMQQEGWQAILNEYKRYAERQPA